MTQPAAEEISAAGFACQMFHMVVFWFRIAERRHGMSEEKNPIQVADRLFGAVEYLAAHGASGLMDLAEALGLHKSTMHRVLMSLQYLGYVTQDADTGRYELTWKIVALSDSLREKADVLPKLRPFLQRLMEKTQETVHLVRLDGTDAVYIDKVVCERNSVQMVSRIGSRLPLYRSAVGKAMAATFSEEEALRLWERSTIRKMTPYTITEPEVFLGKLREAREKGYALDNEENEEGVRCIGAALCLHAGPAEYAFSISAPVSRMDDERIRELSVLVLDTKKQIEEQFRV